MCGCFACMYVYTTKAHLVPSGQKRASDFVQLELTDNYELSCRYWELNLAPLKEHPVSVLNY